MKNTTDDHNMGAATAYAQRSRTAKAGECLGGNPPPGPKPVGWKLNGVPAPKLGGTTK